MAGKCAEIVCLCGDVFTTHAGIYQHLQMVHGDQLEPKYGGEGAPLAESEPERAFDELWGSGEEYRQRVTCTHTAASRNRGD